METSEIRQGVIRELRKAKIRVSDAAGYVGLARVYSEFRGVECPRHLTKDDAQRLLHRLYTGSPDKNYSTALKLEDLWDSTEWKRVRYTALLSFGCRCMCCSATAASGARLFVDHHVPPAQAPTEALNLDNLQIRCQTFRNEGKSPDRSEIRRQLPSRRIKRKPTRGWYRLKVFYESPDWKSTREVALARYGPVCQCCGASRADGSAIHVDNIKPMSKFPHLALDLSNLQVLCEECNLGKLAWDYTDFRNVV